MSAPVNWLQQMQSALQTIPAGVRPRLLLHACCGPCSSAVLEQLRRTFDITVYYYNPNTWPEAEYRRRGQELARLLQQLKHRQQRIHLEKLRRGNLLSACGQCIYCFLQISPGRGTHCVRSRVKKPLHLGSSPVRTQPRQCIAQLPEKLVVRRTVHLQKMGKCQDRPLIPPGLFEIFFRSLIQCRLFESTRFQERQYP